MSLKNLLLTLLAVGTATASATPNIQDDLNRLEEVICTPVQRAPIQRVGTGTGTSTDVDSLRFAVTGTYRSEYKQSEEKNYYTNVITVKGVKDAPLTLDMIGSETKIRFIRAYVDNSNKVYNPDIAILKFGSAEVENGTGTIPYTISDVTDGVTITKVGTFNVTNGVVDINSGIVLTDEFSVSTKNNDHPYVYVYQVHVTVDKEVGADCDTEPTKEVCSSAVVVPVYKTQTTVSGVTYSYDEVKADAGRTLSINTQPNVNFVLTDYASYIEANKGVAGLGSVGTNDVPNPEAYVLCRDGENYVAGINLNENGSYTSYSYNGEIESANFTTGNYYTTINTVDVTDRSFSDGATANTYVGIIATAALDENGKSLGDEYINTYGSDIKTVENVSLTLAVDGEEVIDADSDCRGYMTVTNDKKEFTDYVIDLKLQSAITSGLSISDDSDVNYRLWRKIDGGEYTLVDYGTLSIESSKTSTTYTYGSHALSNSNKTLAVQDAFKGTYLNSENGAKSSTVKYIARVYAKDASGKYYVAQSEEVPLLIDLNDTNKVHTAIDDVDASREVASVTYYSTMGHASSLPHDGINIVVTRYSDGTTATTRLLK